MNKEILDLYTDYLVSSFGQTTSPDLSKLPNGNISHDQVSRILSNSKKISKDLRYMLEPKVRKMQCVDGAMILDDSIEKTPYSDEYEIVYLYYDVVA